MFLKQIFQFVERSQTKKILIFSGVSVFAIQSLISIINFSVNIPHADDWPPVVIALHYLQNDPKWIDLFLSHVNEHYLYTYRLIMMVGLLLNSFNIQQFMIVNWGFFVSSIVIFYIFLKKTDSRFVWLIIPISAFIFHPKMVSANLIASFGLQWIGTFFYLSLVVGILFKEKLSKFWFVVAMCISIVATFNTFIGLLTWVIGIVILFSRFKENRVHFLVWLSISIIVFSLYYSDMEFEDRENSILSAISVEGFYWGLQYVSTSFSIGYLQLEMLAGFTTLFSLIFISGYFLKKRVNKAYPWIVFGLVGILSTIIMTGGRFGVRPPTEGYLIPISLFVQISVLVLLTILFFDIKKSKKKIVSITTILYIIFVSSQFVLFSSAYVVGYQYQYEMNNEQSNWITCFDLPSNLDACAKAMWFVDEKIWDILIERKINIFSDNEFFLKQEQKMEQLSIKWNSFRDGTGDGNIEKINGQEVSDNSSILIDNPFVNIKGWISASSEIKEMYLFIDDKVFLVTSNFNENVFEKFDNGHAQIVHIDTTFFSAFLEKGCHELSIGGVYDNQKFVLEENIQICKK